MWNQLEISEFCSFEKKRDKFFSYYVSIGLTEKFR